MKSLIRRLFSNTRHLRAVSEKDSFNFVDFPCQVTGCISSHQFTVRCDNGRSYKVQAAQYLAHLMDHQARVRITGSLKDGIVSAESIIPLGEKAHRFHPVLNRARH